VVVSLWVLTIVARPLTRLRVLLIMSMAGLFVAAFAIPGISAFFSLDHRPSAEVTLEALVFGSAAGLLIDVLNRTVRPRLFSGAGGSPDQAPARPDRPGS